MDAYNEQVICSMKNKVQANLLRVYRSGTKFFKQYKDTPHTYPSSVLDKMLFDIPDPKVAKKRKAVGWSLFHYNSAEALWQEPSSSSPTKKRAI